MSLRKTTLRQTIKKYVYIRSNYARKLIYWKHLMKDALFELF